MKSGRKKKRQNQPKQIQNRRARHDYALGDSLVVGIALTGQETKALRLGRGQLTGAYVTVKEGEIYLIGATVQNTSGINLSESDQIRTRKLLAKRREIDALIAAKQQGKSIVPLDIITTGRFIKLRLAVGKGKRQYDKRQTIKQRDTNREVQRALRPK